MNLYGTTLENPRAAFAPSGSCPPGFMGTNGNVACPPPASLPAVITRQIRWTLFHATTSPWRVWFRSTCVSIGFSASDRAWPMARRRGVGGGGRGGAMSMGPAGGGAEFTAGSPTIALSSRFAIYVLSPPAPEVELDVNPVFHSQVNRRVLQRASLGTEFVALDGHCRAPAVAANHASVDHELHRAKIVEKHRPA
jgi:hypothetical protein